jgi:uncharacterized protein (TIGR00725 family)
VRRPVVGVIGAGEPSSEALAAARRLGRLAAEAGWVVLTGGRPAGVMEAACAGATEVSGSLTIGVLSGGPGSAVAGSVDVAIFTGLGEARNVVNVLTSDVVVACGVEGPGTASEVSLALRLGRPTILLAPSAAAEAFFRTVQGATPLDVVDTPESAIEMIRQRFADPAAVPRPIRGFHQDEEGHWVADLECGHSQHVRHDPPWQVRPWVLTAEGRAGRLGSSLSCRLCVREP